MRHITDSMAAEAVAAIDARLDTIVATERVAIPLAIESGSRAWGFPSPDSDYDCRFVYVRKANEYLSPWTLRDVIETPLEGELDVNGWDLGKALKLMLKGNAVIIEWLQSPITYRDDPEFRTAFLELARRYGDRMRVARHYLNFGEQLLRRHFADPDQVKQKKIFYVLRPAAALRWLRYHPDAAIAPMRFQDLMAQSDPPRAVVEVAAALIEKKAVTRELGLAPLPREIAEFVASEFETARAEFLTPEDVPHPDAREAAAEFFRQWVRRFDARA